MSLHPPRRSPEEETRLIILYTIRHLPPCTGVQLQQILFDYNEMNYFDMMFALNDLCANGQAIREADGDQHVYAITPAGEEALLLFGNRVPGSIRQYIAEKGLLWQARLKEGEQYPHQIRKTEKGEWVLSLGVQEKDAPLMQLTLSLPSYEMAAQMAKNWPEKASAFYAGAIGLLSEEEK